MPMKVFDQRMSFNAKAKGCQLKHCLNLGICPNAGVTLWLTLAGKGVPAETVLLALWNAPPI